MHVKSDLDKQNHKPLRSWDYAGAMGAIKGCLSYLKYKARIYKWDSEIDLTLRSYATVKKVFAATDLVYGEEGYLLALRLCARYEMARSLWEARRLLGEDMPTEPALSGPHTAVSFGDIDTTGKETK